MTGILIRIILYAVIIAMIYLGVRKIVADWRTRFRQMDDEDRKRDRRERSRPDVIELKRDDDGVYRPGEKRGQDTDRGGR